MEIRRRPPNPSIAVLELQYQIATPDSTPLHILEEIVWHKENEVDQLREKLPLLELQKKMQDRSAPKNFLQALRSGKTQPAAIAEIKKASPSKGVIREDFDPVAIAQSYQAGGATCLSVLTDQKFFQGSFDYLAQVRLAVDLPLLCKDFVIYPYQMYWAKLHGADAVLLIAAILADRDLQYFLKIAKVLQLTPLVEVHSLEELDRVLSLDDFSVNLGTTAELITARQTQLADKGITIVSESGIHSPSDLQTVQQAGANAVLIGESLMRQPDPGIALQQLFSATLPESR
jgi:indole-3-glycerol phosphate synthase